MAFAPRELLPCDQAADLRRLVRSTQASTPTAVPLAGSTVLVASGKGGSGTTTLAWQLALAAQQRGRGAFLDATPGGSFLTLYGASPSVRASGLRIARPLDTLHGLPGWGTEPGFQPGEDITVFESAPVATSRRQRELIIVDVGTGLTPLPLRGAWQGTVVIVVLTPDAPGLLAAYALLKRLAAEGRRRRLATWVNRSTAKAAAEIHARLARASQRFLGLPLHSLGAIPEDPHRMTLLTAGSATPRVSVHPAVEAGMERLLDIFSDDLPRT